MKKVLLILTLALTFGAVKGQITGVEIEEWYVHPDQVLNDGTNLFGYTTYRLYATCTNTDDFVSAVYGVQDQVTNIWAEGGFWQHPNGGPTVADNDPDFYMFTESLEYDSFVTIGKENANEPGTVYSIEDGSAPWKIPFEDGEPIVMSGLIGGSWYTTNQGPEISPNGYAGDDLKVMIAQFTTNSCINGYINIEVFIHAVGSNPSQGHYNFSTCDAAFGCMDTTADNYDSQATADDGNCTYPCALALNTSDIAAPLCAGNNNGHIHLTTEGGQGFVTYQLNGGSNLAVGNWNNLTNGTYNIHIEDGQGCAIDTSIVLNTMPISLSMSVFQPILCNGDANGMITGTFSGGTGMIMFDMDPEFMTPACFPDYANLGPGTYSVYAMDENGCEVQSNTVTLTNPAVLNLSLQASSDATCSDSDDGQLVMFATGGTGDKDYGTDGINYQEGAVLHLAGGDYLVYVIDENGCTDTLSATVDAPAPISILPTITDVLCAGDTNGVVNTLASGGNGGFTYSFEGGNFSTLHNWTNLAPGEYMVDVLDNEDCAAQLMVTVGEPDELMADVSVTDISCFGEEDGAFEIMATGGTPMYMYGLDTLVTDTDPMYGDFGAGTITYYVMDANGCMTMGEATIIEPDELTVTIDASDNEYEGGNGGFIDITIEGGTGNYDISWTSDQGFSSSDEDISDLSGPATYTVTITDENGCSTSTEQVIDFIVGVQEIFNNVAFSAVPNPTNGTFFLNISGLNNQKVAYTLTDVSGRMVAGEELNTLSGEYRTEINITDAASGMYYLTLTVAEQSSTIKVIKQK